MAGKGGGPWVMPRTMLNTSRMETCPCLWEGRVETDVLTCTLGLPYRKWVNKAFQKRLWSLVAGPEGAAWRGKRSAGAWQRLQSWPSGPGWPWRGKQGRTQGHTAWGRWSPPCSPSLPPRVSAQGTALTESSGEPGGGRALCDSCRNWD